MLLSQRPPSSESGKATLEFVLIFPFIMYLFFLFIEVGLFMTRSALLDRALNLTIRDLRVGALVNVDHDDLKALLCQRALIIGDCLENLRIDMAPISVAFDLKTNQTICIDHAEKVQPVVTFDPGARSEIVVIRACILVRPIFPASGMGAKLTKDVTGRYAITSIDAFLNEPK